MILGQGSEFVAIDNKTIPKSRSFVFSNKSHFIIGDEFASTLGTPNIYTVEENHKTWQ